MLSGRGSGTIYRAGTVCFVLNGPYVALTEIGCELWKTVNRSIDNGMPPEESASSVSDVAEASRIEGGGNGGKCCLGCCLMKKPPSLFSKWTLTLSVCPETKILFDKHILKLLRSQL